MRQSQESKKTVFAVFHVRFYIKGLEDTFTAAKKTHLSPQSCKILSCFSGLKSCHA